MQERTLGRAISRPLAERVAVVTGAGGGLGRGICAALASRGAAIAAIERDDERLAGLDAELAPHGTPLATLAADLADADAIAAMAAEVVERLGPVDILVNNAGIYPRRPWTDVSAAEWDQVMAVNVRACMLGAQAFAPGLRASGRGRIVSVSSTTFYKGAEQLAAYIASKGAIIGLTRALARELGPDGVTVNAIAPGAFPTDAEKIHPDLEAYERMVLEQQCIKRRGRPEDVGALVAFLASDDASFITGQTIVIDGGSAFG